MNSVRHILGASARFDVLQALYYQIHPVGLRRLARLANVHPHSAERMLKDLVKEKVVRRKKSGAHTMYTKNTNHEDWATLKAVFDAADQSVRDLREARLNERAKTLLPFIEEARPMLKTARKHRHVT